MLRSPPKGSARNQTLAQAGVTVTPCSVSRSSWGTQARDAVGRSRSAEPADGTSVMCCSTITLTIIVHTTNVGIACFK